MCQDPGSNLVLHTEKKGLWEQRGQHSEQRTDARDPWGTLVALPRRRRRGEGGRREMK